jgi:hypothetical protein
MIAKSMRMAGVLGLSLAAMASAHAGNYSDNLARCLVSKTTPQERAELMRWVFAAVASHPAVRSIATVSRAQMEESNKAMGTMFTRLMSESCKKEAQLAMRADGPDTFELSLEAFGKFAGQELAASPEVNASLAEFHKYVDKDKLNALAAAP